MIYITGDTHGLIDFRRIDRFLIDNRKVGFTYDDYLIITGDSGILWDDDRMTECLARYMNLPFTILFVDGNHENFGVINSLPVDTWNGGKVHKIADNIFHLMRGQVFTIDGKKIFTFGGASSTDRGWRVQGVSWWPEEVPSLEEYDEAMSNLKKHDFKVDFIITHTCDEKALYYPPVSTSADPIRVYPENRMLTNFEEMIDYGHWYFGHYHLDGDLTDKKTVICQKVIRIY